VLRGRGLDPIPIGSAPIRSTNLKPAAVLLPGMGPSSLRLSTSDLRLRPQGAYYGVGDNGK